jgi:hypothetical protein
MNHVQTPSQVCSRPDLDAPKIIDSEKIPGASCVADTTRG